MPQGPVLSEELALLMQRVADGEASDADLERWSECLDADPGLLETLEAFQGQSVAVGAALKTQAAQVPALDLERRIMRALDTAPLSPWERVKAWVGAYRWVLAPLAAGGLATALAVGLPGVLAGGGTPGTGPSQEPGDVAAADVPNADVDELTVEGTAVVFQASPRVTVIWVTSPESGGLDAPSEVTSHRDAPRDVAR